MARFSDSLLVPSTRFTIQYSGQNTRVDRYIKFYWDRHFTASNAYRGRKYEVCTH
jgi:hypothetical protein